MSQGASSTFGTLHMPLAPSASVLALLAVAHLGGAACTLASGLPPWLAWPLAAAVLLQGVRCVAVHASGRAERAIVHLSWDDGGRWRLTRRDGQVLDAVLEHGSYSHPVLVALALRAADGRLLRVLVVPDRVDAGHFHRLRVRLRCEGAGDPSGDRTPLC